MMEANGKIFCGAIVKLKTWIQKEKIMANKKKTQQKSYRKPQRRKAQQKKGFLGWWKEVTAL